jgi:23S rRNA (guanosine2251-2'-O)-methyltransferase
MLADSARLAGLRRLADAAGVPIGEATRAQLDRLCKGGQHQGVAVYAPELALRDWSEVLASGVSLCVALDGIVDPQNFGAVVRSAEGLARACVLWPENSSAPLTPATFRASAGAIEHATLCRVASLPSALTVAKAQGLRVVGLDGQADARLQDLSLAGPTVIAVGSEGTGLSKAVRRTCDHLARLAMPKSIDSLNASVAAAIALYECQRQREQRDSIE